jgi:hypothetical protein
MMTDQVQMQPMENKMLRLPIQVAPVERAAVPSALAGGAGVEASAWWNDIISAIPQVLQAFR